MKDSLIICRPKAGDTPDQNPMLNKNGEACGFCGKTPDQFDSCAEPQHN